MRLVISVFLVLLLAGCSLFSGDQNQGSAPVPVPPSDPARDQALLEATIITEPLAGTAFTKGPEAIVSVERGGNSEPFFTSSPECTALGNQYFSVSETVTVEGPTLTQDDGGLAFTAYATGGDAYATVEDAERIMAGLRNNSLDFCLKRELEPVFGEFDPIQVRPSATNLIRMPNFNNETTVGLRLQTTGFLNQDVVTPTLDFVYVRVDRFILAAFFFRGNGNVFADTERQVLNELRTRFNAAVAAAAVPTSPAGSTATTQG